MQYQQLKNTDFEVSRIAFGCWGIVGGFNWGLQDEKDSLEALTTAFDAGITFFDTAEAYGNGYSEELLAKALGSHRKEMIIGSKALPQNYSPELLQRACENSLHRLKTDYLDLYQLHWPSGDFPLDETLGVLEELKQAGKIRAYGLSNYGVDSLKLCEEKGFTVASNQMAYNLIFRAIEYEIAPACEETQIPILCYSPLMQGLLVGKFQGAEEVPEDRARTRHFASTWPQTRHGEPGAEAETFATVHALKTFAQENGLNMGLMSLAWLLSKSFVGSIIVGARNARQARSNVEAAQLVLTPAQLAELDQLTDALKEKLGPNADLWQGLEDNRVK